MGLIGNVLSVVIGIPSATDRALLDTLCLASLADGHATELELGHAREIALEMPGFRRKSREGLQAELEEALTELKAHDTAHTMKRIAASIDDGDAREQAFALAAVVIYVDLDKGMVESAFLEELRNVLAITEPRGRAILAEIEAEVETMRRGDAPAPGT
jgi:hypothetical protein